MPRKVFPKRLLGRPTPPCAAGADFGIADKGCTSVSDQVSGLWRSVRDSKSIPQVSRTQKMKQNHSLLARVGTLVFKDSIISGGKAKAAVGALPGEHSLKTSLG